MTPRRLHAPRHDRAVLAEPPWADLPRVAAANRAQLGAAAVTLLGRPLPELRRQARRAALGAATAYLREAGEPLPASASESLFLAGHQPELFHPGVWIKNFALQGLARQLGATPLNLVVDNDTAKSAALRLPALADQASPWPRRLTLPFDHWSGEVPYEERVIQDEALFATLPDRAAPLLEAWGYEPLLDAFWDEARRQAARTPLLGERFAGARRALERRWGCHNHEVPLSRLCATEPFAWFAGHVAVHAEQFRAVHNACLDAYRRRHGLRGHNHPVPDLQADGDWQELPFWAWRSGQVQRRRLFARRTESALALRAGTEPWPRLPLGADGDFAPLVRAWRGLEEQGYKVRTRALTTTLFARLCLGDLFLHGIGGGTYDEVTDAIARRFFGIEPPGYLVLSATLLLPLPAYPASPDACRRLARQLRDLHWNPQRFLTPQDGTTAALLAERRTWLDRDPADRRGRRERFRSLRRITEQLRAQVAGREQALRAELAQCERQVQANAVLRRRDYAFCLYPEGLLRSFCTQFLEPVH